MRLRAGILALQGDVEAHARVLLRLGAEPALVRRVGQLDPLDALILPGGESTTLLNLMADEPWFEGLRSFHARGGAMLGTCAGAILLAREVRDPAQPSLGLLDVAVRRNAFGRQVDSFETSLAAPALGGSISGVFIRAPRFTAIGPGVEVVARWRGEPVLVREGRIVAGTFHPEIAGDDRLHRWFLRVAGEARDEAAGGGAQRAAS